MKIFRFILLSLLVLGIQPAFAQEGSLLSGDTQNYIGYGAIVLTLVVLIIALLAVLKSFKQMERMLLGSTGVETAKAGRKAARTNLWNKLLSLRPMSEESNLIMEDEYDGIRELNNPTPAWFMYLFYITIAFAIGYLLVYHVFKSAPLQYDEYKNEVALAEKEKAAMLAKGGGAHIDENTVKLTTDPAVLASGKTIFMGRCVACHGHEGQGIVGPNLTDDYWLHGNTIKDLFRTIEYGVPDKGMPTWEKMLSTREVSDVANYVKSLHGTNPPNPKEPQGTKMTDDASAKSSPKTAELLKK